MTQPPADVKVPCDARRRVALRSADRRRLGGSGGWRRKCLEELPPTLNCQWRVRGGNDRPQQYLVRLKNQPTCPLLQLRYGPSGSKPFPAMNRRPGRRAPWWSPELSSIHLLDDLFRGALIHLTRPSSMTGQVSWSASLGRTHQVGTRHSFGVPRWPLD
jgi:hypothetical protein